MMSDFLATSNIGAAKERKEWWLNFRLLSILFLNMLSEIQFTNIFCSWPISLLIFQSKDQPKLPYPIQNNSEHAKFLMLFKT